LVALYITSSERGSGKTALCAGLGKHWLDKGKKVGFLKPVISGSKKSSGTDSDAAFIKQVFALAEPADLLCPTFSDAGNLKNKINETYGKVSQGKDVVLIEATFDQSQASVDIVAALDARVIIVEDYAGGAARKTASYKEYGKNLLGVVVNKVPGSRLEDVRSELSSQLQKDGATLLGVLPEDRTLLAPTIGELAGYIEGEILSGAEKSAELVENLMLGALTVDSGPYYFSRSDNKAVILKSERTDMQMAALETSIRCLVISGDTELKPVVLTRAEEKKVPIILAKDDTATIAGKIEEALGKTRFNQENKLPRLDEIMGQHLDLAALSKGLGLTS